MVKLKLLHANAVMMSSLRAGDAASGSALLERHGVCWLEDVVPADALAALAQDALASFGEVLRAVACRLAAERCGLPEHLHALCRMPVQCAEVIERDGGRFDSRHGLASLRGLLEAPSDGVLRLVEVLEAVLGPELAVTAHGQVVALGQEGRERYLCAAGGGAQEWHADGPHLFEGTNTTLPAHALTCFIPIADVGEAAGPTEFALGTHRAGCSLPEAQAAGEAPASVAVTAPAGSAVLFDYRVWHRGLPNTQSRADRHVLYLVVGKPWWRDHRNHLHAESIFATAADDEADAPEWAVATAAAEQGANAVGDGAVTLTAEETTRHGTKRGRDDT